MRLIFEVALVGYLILIAQGIKLNQVSSAELKQYLAELKQSEIRDQHKEINYKSEIEENDGFLDELLEQIEDVENNEDNEDEITASIGKRKDPFFGNETISVNKAGCTFRIGFGTKGSAKYMGIKANAAQCIKTCIERKTNTIGNINGVIVSTASVVNVHCYCALGMSGNNGIKYWKTCIFNPGYNSNTAFRIREARFGNMHLVPLLRFWNVGIMDHFYTSKTNEIGNIGSGWKYESIQCLMLKYQYPGSVPFHRYWNEKMKDHLYTTNVADIGTTVLGVTGKDGYTYEGVEGYCYPNEKAGTIPLKRYFKIYVDVSSGLPTIVMDSFYTTKKIGSYKEYKPRGVACYVFPNR